MPKSPNSSDSDTIRVTLSVQSIGLLEQLAERGIYGRNGAEVAGRFIDKALQEFTEAPNVNPSQQKLRFARCSPELSVQTLALHSAPARTQPTTKSGASSLRARQKTEPFAAKLMCQSRSTLTLASSSENSSAD